jgi:hypothetical protein
MDAKKVILDSVEKTLPTWSAVTNEGKSHWYRHYVDIAESGHSPICNYCNATLEDGEPYWLCMDGGEEVCEECVLFSTASRKCPECLDEMHFCDDGEDDEMEKKIYSCNNQECPTEIVDIFRYKE